MPRTDVLYYQEGDDPVFVPILDWLETLPKKVQDKCQAYLTQLEDFGHELRRPVADYLRDGIYELRPSYRGVHYRILYFFPKLQEPTQDRQKKAVVVSHGATKEMKVQAIEIDRAIERKKRFEANPDRHTFRRSRHG